MGINDIDPCAIKLAWESPDSERTASSQDRKDRGTLAHLIVLQPELILERVAVWRGNRRAGNDYCDWQEENSGKLQITATDWSNVNTAINAMRSLPKVACLFCGIEAEVAMFGTEKCGDGKFIKIKGQVDGINRGTRTIVDLKTTEAGIDQRSVERTIRNLHYREKMAMYRRWLSLATGTSREAWGCYNVFMSMKPPFGVVIVKFSSDALAWGEERMQAAIDSTAACLIANQWPLYCREIFMNVEMWESEDDYEDVDYGK